MSRLPNKCRFLASGLDDAFSRARTCPCDFTSALCRRLSVGKKNGRIILDA